MSPRHSTTVDDEETVAVDEASAETTEEAPAPAAWRYFTVSAEIQLATQDQNVSADSIEAAVKEQVILPSAVSVLPAQVTVVGVTSGGVSEQSTPTQIGAGYGREAPPEEE